MICDKIGYNDAGQRQVYAVGIRRSINAPLEILATFVDVDANGYNASNEADTFLAKLESSE